MTFRYLLDPLFLLCFATYFANRWGLKPFVSGGFLHEHLNDMICAPFFLPIMLTCYRKMGWRRSDNPPNLHEVLIPVVVWALLFEVVLPMNESWGKRTTADPKDVFYYVAGAFCACAFWTHWYTQRGNRQSCSSKRSLHSESVVKKRVAIDVDS